MVSRIGFGAVVGNIPGVQGMPLGVYDEGSVLWYLYFGVSRGIFPPLIFLGIGAMTDFSTMLSNPKLVLLGAAAQIGILLTFTGALFLGFTPAEAGAIGIIGGADGPTSIFLAAKLAPELLGAIAIAAYSYMALVPVIQPPIMRLLTTEKERLIRGEPSDRTAVDIVDVIKREYAELMVEEGDADAFLSGFSSKYADVIRPAIQIAGTSNQHNHAAGMYIVHTKRGPYFFADTTVNIQPCSRSLIDTAVLVAEQVEHFNN